VLTSEWFGPDATVASLAGIAPSHPSESLDTREAERRELFGPLEPAMASANMLRPLRGAPSAMRREHVDTGHSLMFHSTLPDGVAVPIAGKAAQERAEENVAAAASSGCFDAVANCVPGLSDAGGRATIAGLRYPCAADAIRDKKPETTVKRVFATPLMRLHLRTDGDVSVGYDGGSADAGTCPQTLFTSGGHIALLRTLFLCNPDSQVYNPDGVRVRQVRNACGFFPSWPTCVVEIQPEHVSPAVVLPSTTHMP
jgi:hypothetical protein